MTRPIVVPGTGARLGFAIGRLRRGTGDPTHRFAGGRWWRAAHTPEGPALLSAWRDGDAVRAQAWGDGAQWTLDTLPRLLGCDDDVTGFVAHHPVIQEAWRRHPHLRVGATGLVLEAPVPACLEQRVTGKEAFAAYRLLVRRFGAPAPGAAQLDGSPAAGMFVPPSADAWARVPSWEFTQVGVDAGRARALVLAARRAAALERLSATDADRGLRSLPGIGVWTSARVRQRAWGDADAWSEGDYHVPAAVTWALAGDRSGEQAGALLASYAGHRYRAETLIGLVGAGPPRRGPRMSLPTHLPTRPGAA